MTGQEKDVDEDMSTAMCETTDVNQHNFNLLDRSDVNYQKLHKYGEYQVMQMQKTWIKNLQSKNIKDKDKTVKINMETKDILRNIIGLTMTQMSKEDKYAQVSAKEVIKRHSQKAIDAILTKLMHTNPV